MESTTINDLTDFDKVVAGLTLSTMCRGVSNENYDLTPSLFRHPENSDFDTLEKQMMWLFKLHSRPHLKRLPTSELEWLVLAQHHGLPTRLLDWSLSPLIAMYFAVQSLSDDNGAIYLYDPNSFEKDDAIKLDELKKIAAFLPPHDSPRVAAQQGMFTIHPTSHTTLNADSIQKLIIPTGAKHSIMGKLTKYGIHDATAFPDLDGLSKHLRRLKKFHLNQFMA